MINQNAFGSMVLEIMTQFADQTGLSPPAKSPRRYLWTDAFAVCNFLELYRQSAEEKYKSFALRLVDQVHNTLGRHREDDPRDGWISGLSEEEGIIHPTKGGLRIGKELNERGPEDRFDEQLEWDRDGQYYHYLTKWMHALNRVSHVTGDSTYNILAIELAKTAHNRFTYFPLSGGEKRMYWKMSIDLSYPIIKSMGHHDPLDGLITYYQLQSAAVEDTKGITEPDLSAEIAQMAAICEGKSWATDDPLGLGGLLCDASRVAQLIIKRNFEQTDLLQILLDASLLGLESYAKSNPLNLPAEYRLAFRELGLSIGLRAVSKLQRLIEEHSDLFIQKNFLLSRIETAMKYASLVELIEQYWLEPTNREVPSWTKHMDINRVMLATCLAPDGYLTI